MTKVADQVRIRFGCFAEARFYAKTNDIKTIIPINQYKYVGIGEKCIFIFENTHITEYYKHSITAGDYIPENHILLAVKEGFPSFCFFSNNDYENMYQTDFETMDSCVHTLKYLHHNKQIVVVGNNMTLWEYEFIPSPPTVRFIPPQVKLTKLCVFLYDCKIMILNPPVFDNEGKIYVNNGDGNLTSFKYDKKKDSIIKEELIHFISNMNFPFDVSKQTNEVLTADELGLTLWNEYYKPSSSVPIGCGAVTAIRFVNDEFAVLLDTKDTIILADFKTGTSYNCYNSDKRVTRVYSYNDRVFLICGTEIIIIKPVMPWRLWSPIAIPPTKMLRIPKLQSAARLLIQCGDSHIKFVSPSNAKVLNAITLPSTESVNDLLYDRGFNDMIHEQLFVLYNNGIASIYSTAINPCIITGSIKNKITALTMFPLDDGTPVYAVGTASGTLILHDYNTLERIKNQGVTEVKILRLFYHSGTKNLLIVTGKKVILWDWRKSTSISTIKANYRPIINMFMDKLFIAHNSGKMTVIEVVDNQLRFHDSNGVHFHLGKITQINTFGSYMITSSLDKSIRIWSSDLLLLADIEFPSPILCCCFRNGTRDVLVGVKKHIMIIKGSLLFGNEIDAENKDYDNFDSIRDELDEEFKPIHIKEPTYQIVFNENDEIEFKQGNPRATILRTRFQAMLDERQREIEHASENEIVSSEYAFIYSENNTNNNKAKDVINNKSNENKSDESYEYEEVTEEDIFEDEVVEQTNIPKEQPNINTIIQEPPKEIPKPITLSESSSSSSSIDDFLPSLRKEKQSFAPQKPTNEQKQAEVRKSNENKQVNKANEKVRQSKQSFIPPKQSKERIGIIQPKEKIKEIQKEKRVIIETHTQEIKLETDSTNDINKIPKLKEAKIRKSTKDSGKKQSNASNKKSKENNPSFSKTIQKSENSKPNIDNLSKMTNKKGKDEINKSSNNQDYHMLDDHIVNQEKSSHNSNQAIEFTLEDVRNEIASNEDEFSFHSFRHNDEINDNNENINVNKKEIQEFADTKIKIDIGKSNINKANIKTNNLISPRREKIRKIIKPVKTVEELSQNSTETKNTNIKTEQIDYNPIRKIKQQREVEKLKRQPQNTQTTHNQSKIINTKHNYEKNPITNEQISYRKDFKEEKYSPKPLPKYTFHKNIETNTENRQMNEIKSYSSLRKTTPQPSFKNHIDPFQYLPRERKRSSTPPPISPNMPLYDDGVPSDVIYDYDEIILRATQGDTRYYPALRYNDKTKQFHTYNFIKENQHIQQNHANTTRVTQDEYNYDDYMLEQRLNRTYSDVDLEDMLKKRKQMNKKKGRKKSKRVKNKVIFTQILPSSLQGIRAPKYTKNTQRSPFALRRYNELLEETIGTGRDNDRSFYIVKGKSIKNSTLPKL